MGCFSYTCSISGLPIDYNTPVRFMALGSGEHYLSAYDLGREWAPVTLPIRARYNDYGSVDDIEECPVTEAFFETLNRRAIERAVGERPRFDMAVKRGMPQDEWLSALFVNRIQIKGPDGRTVPVVQTMIREDVWRIVVDRDALETEHRREFETFLRLETLLERELLREPKYERAVRELFAVFQTLRRLGRPWARGTCCGPQSGEWEAQLAFMQAMASIAQTEVDRITEDWSDPQ